MNNWNSSHGLWAKTAPAKPSFEALKEDKTTDVLVIGGGYTGLSAGLHLSRKGIPNILLEAEGIGFGGAGRNVGLVNAGLWLMPGDVVSKLGSDIGEELIRVLGKSPDLVFDLIDKYDIECEAVRTGTLHCAHSPGGYKALRQREEQWQDRGAPVKLYNADEAAPMIGSTGFHGALLDKRAGTVQPLAYAYGLARAAKETGTRIYTGSPVLSHKRTKNHWVLTTPNGSVTAKAVILAVQGYAAHAFEDMGKNLVPFNYFQFATQPLPEDILKTILPGKQGAWDTALVLSSYRLDQSGRLIVGSVGQADGSAYSLHKKWIERSISRVFPQVGDVSLDHAWYGRIAMTTNHIPRFHILGPDFITVTSYNGRGIGPGSVFGKLMAEYIEAESTDNIPLPVSEPRPVSMRGVRGLYYEAGARVYHLVQRRTRIF